MKKEIKLNIKGKSDIFNSKDCRNTLGIISGVAINLSNSINPPFICSIKSSPPTISAPAFFASSNFSPVEF